VHLSKTTYFSQNIHNFDAKPYSLSLKIDAVHKFFVVVVHQL